MLAGENVAANPRGRPVTVRTTADRKLPITELVTGTTIELPGVTVAALTVELNVKLGTTTLTAIAAVRANPAPLPVIVRVKFPAVALAAAVRVTVTGAAEETVADENLTETPDGTPLEFSVTGVVNPPCGVSVTLTVAVPPGDMETLDTFGVNVKLLFPLSLQWLTSIAASTDPNPVARS